MPDVPRRTSVFINGAVSISGPCEREAGKDTRRVKKKRACDAKVCKAQNRACDEEVCMTQNRACEAEENALERVREVEKCDAE